MNKKGDSEEKFGNSGRNGIWKEMERRAREGEEVWVGEINYGKGEYGGRKWKRNAKRGKEERREGTEREDMHYHK